MIPQCNPKASYEEHAEEIDAVIQAVLKNGRYVLGPEVTAFEREFSEFVGSKFALGVASGTDAITIALRSLNIGFGDQVITVSHTAVATAAGIRAAGASPLFVDVDDSSGLMDLNKLELKLRSSTASRMQRIKAIVPVHLYGRATNMDRVLNIAERYGLSVIEDCAQAHGAEWNGKQVGSFGKFGCFSFYPTKNLGGIGDGGSLTTSDEESLESARLQREYGWKTRYISEIEGGNSRLDELQAAILRVKLKSLSHDNDRRREIAAMYRELISNQHLRESSDDEGSGHVYHQYVVRSKHRDSLREHLAAADIGTLIHYPKAVHQQPAFNDDRYRWTDLSVSDT